MYIQAILLSGFLFIKLTEDMRCKIEVMCPNGESF